MEDDQIQVFLGMQMVWREETGIKWNSKKMEEPKMVIFVEAKAQ